MNTNQHLNGRLGISQSSGKREYQEDDYGVIDGSSGGPSDATHVVLVLADGMGGHAGGDIASRTVVRSFIEAFEIRVDQGSIPDALEHALEAANSSVAMLKKEEPGLGEMGSTIVALVWQDDEIVWISVGDSPLWLYRNSELQRLNQDHSVGGVLKDLVEMGRLSQEEADSDQGKSALRSAIYGEEIELIDGPSKAVKLDPGDVLLLASDGIQTLSDKEISQILKGSKADSSQDLADVLLQRVLDKGLPGQDNTTVMVFRPEGCERKEAIPDEDRQIEEEGSRAFVKGSSRRSKTRSATMWLILIGALCVFFIVSALFVFDPIAPEREKPREPVDHRLSKIADQRGSQ